MKRLGYLSEIHAVHEGVIRRARILHHGFEVHGWTLVFEAADQGSDLLCLSFQSVA